MVRKKSSGKKKRSVRKPDPVFLSIPSKGYKEGKVNLLTAQLKLLESVKNLERIKELQNEKEELKLKLGLGLSQIIEMYSNLQKFLPVLNQYNEAENVELKLKDSLVSSVKKGQPANVSQIVPQTDELDQELKEIQEKLLSLNSF